MLVRIAYVLMFWWMAITNPAMWRFFAPYIGVAVIAAAVGYYIGKPY